MTGERQDSRWVIRPSLWFDAVCLIPLLAGLPFYTSRHEDDARWWQERFAALAGPPARDGVRVLRDEVADRAAKPLPAFLALWTSPAAGLADGAAADLDGLIAAVADPELLPSAMRESSRRWNAADDRLFHSVRPALLAVLEDLRAADLAQWWAEHAAADLWRRCGELTESSAGYDLVPLVEQHTGVCFDTRAVELCVLRWAAPHGIRVTGTRFLTDISYDAGRILNIAVHELLHPPWPTGHPVQDRLDTLALLLYDTVRRGDFDPAAGSYADFLARALSDPDTWPRDLEARYRELTITHHGRKPPASWPAHG